MTGADTMGPTADATWRPRHNPWLIAAAVTLAAFMEILDTTIVNVALRYIAGDLAVSNDDATWVLTSYLVSNGIVLTISGWRHGVSRGHRTVTVGTTETPSGMAMSGGMPLSITILTGTRCTIFTKLPVAFSGGKAVNFEPEPRWTLSTWPRTSSAG